MKIILYTLLIVILLTRQPVGTIDSLNNTTHINSTELSKKHNNAVVQSIPPTIESIESDLKFLIQTPRENGGDNQTKITDWIQSKAKNSNLTVKEQPFPIYEQTINTHLNDYLNLNPLKKSSPIGVSKNIIIQKKASIETGRTLIISAHYDTTKNSKGVVDNASGIVTVLNLLRMLKDTSLPFNIDFIFFGSEEYFLTGSRYYVNQLTSNQKEEIIGCINVDMIGLKNSEKFILSTPSGLSNSLTLQLFPLMDKKHVQGISHVPGQSDHYSFTYAGIPSFNFCDNYVDFNTRKDNNLNNLSLDKLKLATEVLASSIAHIDPKTQIHTHTQDIDINILTLKRNTENLFKNIPKEYSFLTAKEALLPEGLNCKVVYTFKNKQNKNLIATIENEGPLYKNRKTKDFYLNKGFVLSDEGYWIKKEQNSTHIVLKHGIHRYEFIGDFKDVVEISSNYLQ